MWYFSKQSLPVRLPHKCTLQVLQRNIVFGANLTIFPSCWPKIFRWNIELQALHLPLSVAHSIWWFSIEINYIVPIPVEDLLNRSVSCKNNYCRNWYCGVRYFCWTLQWTSRCKRKIFATTTPNRKSNTRTWNPSRQILRWYAQSARNWSTISTLFIW